MSNGGQWDVTNPPVRPGLYANFVIQAQIQINGGFRGIVAMPVFTYGGNAEAGKFYSIKNEKQANDTLGSTNSAAVVRALAGGAAEVIAYAMPAVQIPEADETTQYADMRDAFETQIFNVFAFEGNVSNVQQDATVVWVKRNREEGKHFMVVFGGTSEDDQDSAIGNARSVRVKDDYVVNLITGVITEEGNELSSAEYSSYIAGLIAGTPINQAITYKKVPVVDVNKRLRSSEITEALKSGSLVLVNDGRDVVVEQGITTNSNEIKRGKIRTIRARQAIATDIPATAKREFIGQIDNTPEGRASLVASVMAYLETLADNNVISEPKVTVDDRYESVGDCVYLAISYLEVDSVERIFMTVNI